MRRRHRERDALAPGLREQLRSLLGQSRVRRDHHERRVGAGPRPGLGVRVAVLDDRSVLLVQHRPERVHGGERGDDQLALLDRRAAQAALPAGGGVGQLGERRARPGADAPLLDGSVRRRLTGRVAGLLVGAGRRVPHGEIEQHGRRDDRDPCHPSVEADPSLLEPALDAARGRETEGAPAGEQHRVDLVHGRPGPDGVGLPRPRRATLDVDGSVGAGGTQDHRASRDARSVGHVADPDPRDARDHPHTARSITRSSVSIGAAGAPRRRKTRAAG